MICKTKIFKKDHDFVFSIQNGKKDNICLSSLKRNTARSCGMIRQRIDFTRELFYVSKTSNYVTKSVNT